MEQEEESVFRKGFGFYCYRAVLALFLHDLEVF